MAQIGRQPDHLARRIFIGAIPTDHRLNREAVAQIVDARSPTMFAIRLVRSKPYFLAGLREVVSGTTVGKPCDLVSDKQRRGRTPDQSIAFDEIFGQLSDDARVERQQSFFAELSLPDAQYAMISIEVISVERERLVDPQARNRDQPEQRRTGQPSQAVYRRQRPGRFNDRYDLGICVDMWARPLVSTRQQTSERRFMFRIKAAQPLCEQAYDAEPRRSGRGAGGGQRFVPTQKQRRVDPF
eukprot:gene18310-18574_t